MLFYCLHLVLAMYNLLLCLHLCREFSFSWLSILARFIYLLIGQIDWLFLFYKVEFGIPDLWFGHFNVAVLEIKDF